MKNKPKDELKELERSIMLALLEDINSCNDPIDMFKGLERYRLFNEARSKRAEADSYDAGVEEDEEDAAWK